jgi:hypothetical protein
MSSARGAMAGMMKQLYRCAQDIASSSRSSPISMRVASGSLSSSHQAVNASTLARSLMTASTGNGACMGLSNIGASSLHRSLSQSAPMQGRMAAMSFSPPPSLPPHHDTSHLEKGAPAVDGLLSDASSGSGGAAGGSLSLGVLLHHISLLEPSDACPCPSLTPLSVTTIDIMSGEEAAASEVYE